MSEDQGLPNAPAGSIALTEAPLPAGTRGQDGLHAAKADVSAATPRAVLPLDRWQIRLVLSRPEWCQIEHVPGPDPGDAVIVPSAHTVALEQAKHLARVADAGSAQRTGSVIDLPLLDRQPLHTPVGPQIGQAEACHS